MATLKDVIASIQHDSSWGIWAELVDGEFHADSPARIGQCASENGGCLDGFVFFADGEQCGESFRQWKGDFVLDDWEEWNKIIVLWEEETHSVWADSDPKPVIDWALDQEDGEVFDLVESAKQKWDDQAGEMFCEWVELFIDEMNKEYV